MNVVKKGTESCESEPAARNSAACCSATSSGILVQTSICSGLSFHSAGICDLAKSAEGQRQSEVVEPRVNGVLD